MYENVSLADSIRESLPTTAGTLVFREWQKAPNVSRALVFQAIGETVDAKSGLAKAITVRVKFSSDDLILCPRYEIVPKITISGVQAETKKLLADYVYQYLRTVGFALPNSDEN